MAAGFFFQFELILQDCLGCLGVQFFRVQWIHHGINSSSLELWSAPFLHGQPALRKISAALAHYLSGL